jgi:hypothetical protein
MIGTRQQTIQAMCKSDQSGREIPQLLFVEKIIVVTLWAWDSASLSLLPGLLCAWTPSRSSEVLQSDRDEHLGYQVACDVTSPTGLAVPFGNNLTIRRTRSASLTLEDYLDRNCACLATGT